jgi:hypothetical protein
LVGGTTAEPTVLILKGGSGNHRKAVPLGASGIRRRADRQAGDGGKAVRIQVSLEISSVIPAKAGISGSEDSDRDTPPEIPAFAGMTD